MLEEFKFTSAALRPVADEKKCKGIVVRYLKNAYYNQARGELTFKETFRILQRLSCRGCSNQCQRMWLDEDISACGPEYLSLEIPKNLKHEKIYRLYHVITGHDYETGYADGGEWRLEPVEKEVANTNNG